MPGYWLFKTEPDAFSWDDLKASPRKTSMWDGVRNYRARNFLRDEVKKGDGVLFYHSRVKPPAVVGVARVVRAGYPDPTQFDSRAKYYDPKSSPENPRWFAVDVKMEKALPEPVSLPRMRETPSLEGMILLKKGNRLSIVPVTAAQWKTVLRLGGLR